jgi:hypothetical protein
LVFQHLRGLGMKEHAVEVLLNPLLGDMVLLTIHCLPRHVLICDVHMAFKIP